MLAVTADSCLSGFVTIYFEKVLKTTVLTVWDRNLQLAFYSMLIYGPWTIYDNPTDPFRGWSMVTVIVAVLASFNFVFWCRKNVEEMVPQGYCKGAPRDAPRDGGSSKRRLHS